MVYLKKFKFIIIIFVIILSIIFGLYMSSMLARGIDPRKDTFFCESLGDIPFVANSSNTWAVSQAIAICDGKVVHSVYLFKNYGVWYPKKLIFKFTESETGIQNTTSSDTAMAGIQWQNNTTLKLTIPPLAIEKIDIQETQYKDIKIQYPLLS